MRQRIVYTVKRNELRWLSRCEAARAILCEFVNLFLQKYIGAQFSMRMRCWRSFPGITLLN